MALLKKGSKGKDVEKLQTTLNSFGAKPELKVDSIFGPLTDKALRTAQTKLKLEKVDGKAGEYTMAALKHGKPLPTMDVRDHAKISDEHKLVRANSLALLKGFEDIQKFVDAFDAEMSNHLPRLKKIVEELEAPRTDAAALSAEIAKDQKAFEETLLKNPAKAQALADKVEANSAKYQKLVVVLEQKVDLGAKETSSMATGTKSSISQIEKRYADMKKGFADHQKSVAALHKS